MRNFLIGLVVGIILASSGIYATAKHKAEKAMYDKDVRKVEKSAKKVGKATQDFAETIYNAFN